MEQASVDMNSANSSEVYDLLSIKRSDIDYQDQPFELQDDNLVEAMSDLQPVTNDQTFDEYLDENGLWNPFRFGDVEERANDMQDRQSIEANPDDGDYKSIIIDE